MTPRLTTNYVKNYGNRTLTVKVILENAVTCFLLGHSVEIRSMEEVSVHCCALLCFAINVLNT